MHVCVYDRMRSESESASHSSPPQLKGVQVISECARMCWYYFANLFTVSVGLPVHTVTQKKSHTHISNTKNTDKCIARNDGKSTLDTCIKEKQRVRQTAARYTQKNKQKKSK